MNVKNDFTFQYDYTIVPEEFTRIEFEMGPAFTFKMALIPLSFEINFLINP
jgi:hypothetical protein